MLRENINYLTYSNDPELIKIAGNKVFGFWVYLMSDCIIFATLFATFSVLSTNYLNTGIGKSVFDLRNVMIETICLLSSSLTFGFAILAMQKSNKNYVLLWLSVTFILGAIFLAIELNEFHQLILKNQGPNRNAFFSSFFTLIGTHGCHILIGLVWIMFMLFQVMFKGIYLITKTRLILLSLYWHFLDIIWICIFSYVYLIGYIK